MRILVFLNQLIIGGAEVNGIELSSMLQHVHGHDVTVFATPGPMVEVARQRGLRYLPAPVAAGHPSPLRMRALRAVVRRECPDLVQAWDHRACLDAFYGVHLPMRTPMHMVLTDMDVDRFLPKSVPAAFMTPELVDKARRAGRRCVDLLLPPVDTNANAPGVVDPAEFRARYRVSQRDLTLVTVSRLSNWLKGESLRRTIKVVGKLGQELPVRLLIVGDGDTRPLLERTAADVNARLGREAILLTGAMLDPRPAYAAADIVIGMGGSSLRGLAFAKPVIVVGERGFAAAFCPETADTFYYTGMYGIGDGSPGNEGLESAILGLAQCSSYELAELGRFSREFVVHHFNLDTVASKLDEYAHRSVSDQAALVPALGDSVRTVAVIAAGRLLPREMRKRVAAGFGRVLPLGLKKE